MSRFGAGAVTGLILGVLLALNTPLAGQPTTDLSVLQSVLSAVQSAIPVGANVIGAVFGAPNMAPTDCSGTIASGGTAQAIITANAAIHGFRIENIDNTSGSGEPLWISLTATAVAATNGSIPLQAPVATTYAAPGIYETPLGFGSSHAVSGIATTTGHKYTCFYW